MTKQEIKALQDELVAAKARITTLEACLDEANGHCAWAEADGKKWKARFEWLVKTTCAAVSCGRFGYCNNGCNGFDTWREVLNHIAAYADKEIKK